MGNISVKCAVVSLGLMMQATHVFLFAFFSWTANVITALHLHQLYMVANSSNLQILEILAWCTDHEEAYPILVFKEFLKLRAIYHLTFLIYHGSFWIVYVFVYLFVAG